MPTGADPHAPLRDNVRLLGNLLGQTLREQADPGIYETVELVRRHAKAGRAGDKAAARALEDVLRGLAVEEAVPVARAFAHFLTLANIAEQHHRVRRRRDYLRDPDVPPQRGSFEEVIARLKAKGIDGKSLHDAACSLHIELVLTAHPTEITRRTLIAKHQRIERELGALDRPDLTPDERDAAMASLRREVVAMWETEELRPERPTPEDEARGGFAVIEKVLWDAVPAHVDAMDRALRQATGKGLPLDAAPITFGSWMGGDRDGNPNVTPAVTRRVVLLARWMAADLYLRETNALRNELSMPQGSEELKAATGGAREPYRVVLRGLRDRLENTKRCIEAELADTPVPDLPCVAHAEDLRAPLLLLHRSLEATGLGVVAAGRLTALLRRVACFGTHLVRLDLRQESTRHAEALDAITRAAGLGGYADWDETRRREFLGAALRDGLDLPDRLDAAPEVHDVLETFRAGARLPREALGAYVISMARSPSDVLAVQALQAWAGIDPPLRVVPLFETQDDLERAGETVASLLDDPEFGPRAEAGIEIMIGYSDSAKDAGILAAAWALYRAQEDIVRICAERRVPVTLFHGRGGTVGRGGGPAHAAITGLPRGAVQGRLRITEQGEVINARFGLPGIALRTLELYTMAVLEATIDPPDAPRADWRALMEETAAAAEEAYRGVLRSEGFVPYFRAVTPEEELGRLNIGSRPARRRAAGGLETLRAIPWVFAWTQDRLILPSWLGVGEGLRTARERDGPMLREMMRDWPFFVTLVDLVEMGLAKTDPWIARRYHEVLVPENLKPLGDALFARLDATVDEVKRLVGHDRLMEHNAVLRRSIDVRNPYVDPLNLLQVEFLRRVRASDDPRVMDALLVTMNGIAQGLRNTG